MLNLNVSPYFDDFAESKGFHKILFQPGVAVQARELTQLQTLLQKQIDRLGAHVLKDGSLVTGGAFDYEINVSHITVPGRLDKDWEESEIKGVVTGLKAFVRHVEYDSERDISLVFVRYTNSGLTGALTFASGETCSVVGEPLRKFTLSTSDQPGSGSLFGIAEGVVFARGYLVVFPAQRIVVDENSSEATDTIGFHLIPSIVTAGEDPDLLDNAQGTTNYAAPGADRLAITAKLTRLTDVDNSSISNFVDLLKLDIGRPVIDNQRSQYNVIYDELAKRTYDESGDYTVYGLGVRSREHLNTGDNEGLLLVEDGGDSSKLSIDVEPGLAYVRGYEVNKLVTTHIPVPKCTEFNSVNNQILNLRTGGYVLVKEAVGLPPSDQGVEVQLLNALEARITNKIQSTVPPSGSAIGKARLKYLTSSSGTRGSPSAVYKLYLFDVVMNPGQSVNNVKSVYVSGSLPFFADVISSFKLVDSNTSNMFVPLGTSNIRSVTNGDTGLVDTTFTFNRTIAAAANFSSSETGTFTITSTTPSERMPFGSGDLSSAQRASILVCAAAATDVQLPGTASHTAGSSTLTGTSTFFSRLYPGARIRISSNYYIISSITSNTQATIVGTFANTGTDTTLYRSFLNGDIIDLTTNGSNGSARSVTCNPATNTLTFNLQEDSSTLNGTMAVAVTIPVSRYEAHCVKKSLKQNLLIKINCASLSSLTQPINLGIPDIFKLNYVRSKTGSAFTSVTEGTDITSKCRLDNGQRDNHYDHGKILVRGGVTSTTHLLVCVDSFEADYSQGAGYFSIDSYPIDDQGLEDSTIKTIDIPVYTTTSQKTFDLKDVLDFRLVKQPTAAVTTSIAAASTNPSSVAAWRTADGIGSRLPVPDSDIYVDYSYYLSRRDQIVMDKDGNIVHVQGPAAVYPVTPATPPGTMALASLYIPPYPSISESLARLLSRPDVQKVTATAVNNSRHTMKDIGVLKKRIETLEYYNALSLLEKSAVDMRVVDSEGQDRFKNGFFVDGFLDHSLGDSSNPDYVIAVDKGEQVIRPIFEANSLPLVTLSTSNVESTGNLLTLPYSETPLIEQMNVTTIRNIEQSVFRFIGTIEVTPDNDTWVDTSTYDKRVDFGSNNNLQVGSMQTEWGSWEAYVTGYNLYEQESRWTGKQIIPGTLQPGARQIASFTNAADAYQALRADRRFTTYGMVGGALETVDTSKRTGIQTTLTSFSTESQNIGGYVKDLSLIPYIRPQSIQLYVKGVKANTKFYVFFDGERMNELCFKQPTRNEPGYAPFANGETDLMFNPNVISPKGAELKSDPYGEINIVLVLDETKKFRVGTKKIIVTDSPTNAVDATSYAEGYFVANGVKVEKENLTISTKLPIYNTSVVTESSRIVQKVEILGPSCMAYSFFVDVDPSAEGVFLSSVDVFIESMHPKLGVWFEIREMDTAGGITRTQVPYSEVWMYRNDPAIRFWNGRGAPVATNVKFPSLVFLQNNKQYAFVIHTEGLNPDTYFWVSRLGETDIITGNPVVGRQLKGTLYTTHNNLTYDMVQEVDLMVRFNRAKFNTNAVGRITSSASAIDVMTINPIAAGNSIVGSTVTGSQKVRLSNISGADMAAVGDTVIFNPGNISGVIKHISGDWLFTTATGVTAGSTSTINGKNWVAKVDQVLSGSGTIMKLDANSYTLSVGKSNGHFFSGAALKTNPSKVNMTVVSIKNDVYSSLKFNLYDLSFSQTSTTHSKTTHTKKSNTYNTAVCYATSTEDFQTEQTLYSRSNEVLYKGNTRSIRLITDVQTNSEFVSPVIDRSRANVVYVKNIINADSTGESSTTGGNLINTYISKTVTLAEGMDAEDILVSLKAYRPAGTNVKVWCKLQHAEDLGSNIATDIQWIELTSTNSQISSSANVVDFVDLTFTLPSSWKNSSGVFTYSGDNGTFTTFKHFTVKVGLSGTDSALIPRVGDLRVIALQL